MYSWVEKIYYGNKIFQLENCKGKTKYKIIINQYNNSFRLNCSLVNIQNYFLDVKDIEEAKVIAFNIVLKKLEKAIKDIYELINILNDKNDYSWVELDLKKMKSYAYNFISIYKCERKSTKMQHSIKLYENEDNIFILDSSFAGINNKYIENITKDIKEIQNTAISLILNNLNVKLKNILMLYDELTN